MTTPSEKGKCEKPTCRLCGGDLYDFNDHYYRCHNCSAPYPKGPMAMLRMDVYDASIRAPLLERVKELEAENHELQMKLCDPTGYIQKAHDFEQRRNGLCLVVEELKAKLTAALEQLAGMERVKEAAMPLRKFSQTATDEANWAHWYAVRDALPSGSALDEVRAEVWEEAKNAALEGCFQIGGTAGELSGVGRRTREAIAGYFAMKADAVLGKRK